MKTPVKLTAVFSLGGHCPPLTEPGQEALDNVAVF